MVAYRLGTEDVPGSNPRKDENFSVKITRKEQVLLQGTQSPGVGESEKKKKVCLLYLRTTHNLLVF